MGIYSDWAGRYFESKIYTIPCNGKKAPIFEGWTKYCDVAPSAGLVDGWAKKYSDSNQIGLLLGPSTGKVAFDFDYAYDSKKCGITEDEFKLDRRRIEKEIMELLPVSSLGKVGAKGWTRFYAWNASLLNKNCNRNGVRLFDFLSTGRQTIIPPSIHSVSDNGKIVYKWIDGGIEDEGALPSLGMDIIESMVSLYSDRPRGQRPSIKDMPRHERIMFFILDALRVDENIERIATMAVDYDRLVNVGAPYLIDKKYYDSIDAVSNARAWVLKMQKWAIRNNALKVKGEKKSEKVSGTSWDHFFQTAFKECRKDIFSLETFIRQDGVKWEPIKGHDGILRSYARAKELPKTHVIEELDRWTFENSKLEYLCDIPAWDGVDRVSQFGLAAKSANFTSEEITLILKHWGSNIFRRVKSPEYQNRCIILKGPQGLGKDFFVRSMLRDFKPYYESTTMPGTQKDALEIVSRLLAVHIEEFDQTKGMDMAFLKSLITQPSAFFRESYGASPNQKIMRPSFISTANVDDILRDPTGNRRFIVVPLSGIEWTYPKEASLQVVAQWKAMCEAGECVVLPESLEEKIAALIDSYTPEDLSSTLLDLYRQRMFESLSGESRYRGRLYLTGLEFAEVKLDMAKLANCGVRKVESCIKSAGLSHRFREGMRYYQYLDALEQDRKKGY